MKRFFSTIILLAVAGIAVCQDTVTYPYPCYMEWTMPDTMGRHINDCEGRRKCSYAAYPRPIPATSARQYPINTPTVIYGIAATLWGQDSLRRDLSVTLFTKKGRYKLKPSYFSVIPVKTVRWSASMPFRYVKYRSFDYITSSPTYGQHFEDYVKAYEFYFDTPVVVSDTFFVGIQTLGIDGQQHPYANQANLTGWCCMATQYNFFSREFTGRPPMWHTIVDSVAFSGNPSEFGGVFPITEHPPCNPDTLSCSSVYGLRALPLMSGEVRFTWHQQPSHRQFQISVGPQGTPPDDNPIYEAAGSPFSISDNWDSTILYAAYIRAQCSRYCHPDSTLVWSDWSRPVTFYTVRSIPQGIHSPDKEQNLFSLSPNPAGNSVTITILNPQSYIHRSTLTLRDAAGREIRSFPVTSSSLTIPLHDCPAGSYLVTLTTPQATSTQRLIIK